LARRQPPERPWGLASIRRRDTKEGGVGMYIGIGTVLTIILIIVLLILIF
jgi:hypothetical protein